MQDYDVVIVGFGPSGAVAASWLGQAGIRTLVFDKRQTIWETPRAIAIDHEILRVFQNIGVVEQVLPYTAPFPPPSTSAQRANLSGASMPYRPPIHWDTCLPWCSPSRR